MRHLIKELRTGRKFITFTLLNTVGHGLLFVVPLLVARILAPEMFGVYSLSMMVVYFFGTLLFASSVNPFIVLASEELLSDGRISRTLGAWLIILIVSAAVYGLLTVLFAQPLAAFASISVAQLGYVFLAFVGVGMRRFLEGVFLALDDTSAYAMVEIVTGFFSIIYILIIHLSWGITLQWIFLVFLAAPLTAFLCMSRRLDRGRMFPLVFDRSRFVEIFRHAKWTMLGGTAVYLFNWGDNLVLRSFVTLRDIGIYNLAYQVFKGITILMGTVRAYFLPFLSQHATDPARIVTFLTHKRPRIMAVGAMGILAVMVVLPFAMPMAFGGEYREAIPMAMILMIGSFFILHRLFYEVLFSAQRRYRFTQLSTVCFVALNIGLDVILVKRMGAIGAAVATTITYAAYAVAYEIYFRWYVKPATAERLTE